MASRTDIVVTLDGQVIDPEGPVVRADDPLFARGDGVFETLLVRAGRACLLDAHLERLVRSAAIIGLPPPELDRWRVAASRACAVGSDPADAVLRLVYGRTRHGAGTGFVVLSRLPGRVLAARRDGVAAMTLDRGLATSDATEAPWSIAGAKSLSYALYAAASRHAERLGIDGVVLVASDGHVLEGPRSSVVIADGNGVLVSPPPTLPILAGTTVAAVFAEAGDRGLGCEYRALRVDDLLAAQGVWLLSSITLASRVHTLDGVALPPAPMAARMVTLVDDAVAGRQ